MYVATVSDNNFQQQYYGVPAS